MTTALLSHPDCLEHVTPPGHPEQSARLERVHQILATREFGTLRREEAPLAAESEVLRCHPKSYVDRIRSALPSEGIRPLDADTYVSPGSLTAALRGVGAVSRAVDMVLAGDAHNAFCATRPPGHHAERETPMGFCLFGNIAIAAKLALDKFGLSRVAVFDFDVHHGNGTQALLWDEPRALFISAHQMPLWPGTGAPEERGQHDNILNVPLAPCIRGPAYRATMEREVIPALDAFAPELLLVSAGFDAHHADPLAQLELEEEDFAWITHRLCDIADAHCGGRLVSALEGGYDLEALATSVVAHVRVLMERGK